MLDTIKGSNAEFIKKKIFFAPPPHDAVVTISNIKNEVIVESKEVVELGFVLVKGYLNKSIEYNTANKEMLKKLLDNEEDKKEDKKEDKREDKKAENEDDKKDNKKGKKHVVCEPIAPEPHTMAIDGVVRHTTVWIPFDILVRVDGVKFGDTVELAPIDVKTLNDRKAIHELMEEGLIVGILTNDVINISVIVK